MAGHNKWSKIKRQKAREDAKRGKIFTRLGREIAVAAREGGGDPEMNPALSLAIDRAKEENMPKENIERAIRRGTGEDRTEGELEQITYEAYAPHGVALMIQVITDNRNRTVADLRNVLINRGGNMGESGSVAWQFHRGSYFSFPADGYDSERVFELAVEAGAEDVIFDEYIEIIGPVDAFKDLSDRLKAAGIKPEEGELRWFPDNTISLSQKQTVQVMQVIEQIEDLDDVQAVFSNLDVSEEAVEMLETA